MLAICIPYDEADPAPGNGNMVAIPQGSRELVDRLYARAIEMGGSDEGEPGERMPGFYGGYFRDPDGNGVELYRDRARADWPLDANGDLAMVNAPLDVDALLAEAR